VHTGPPPDRPCRLKLDHLAPVSYDPLLHARPAAEQMGGTVETPAGQATAGVTRTLGQGYGRPWINEF
jgi:hypothetical protein